MTRGGFTKHTIQKGDKQGNIELQERCLYLEKKFQPGGTQSVPAPLDPEVYTRNMKELSVLVRKYPGWIFTAASWEHSHQRFLDEVGGKEKVPMALDTRARQVSRDLDPCGLSKY